MFYRIDMVFNSYFLWILCLERYNVPSSLDFFTARISSGDVGGDSVLILSGAGDIDKLAPMIVV